jgi:phage gpG-like protein
VGEYFDIFGVKELIEALSKTAEAAELAALVIVKRGQVVVEGEAKKQFEYSHPRGTKTPSSPGTPPAVITGTLRRSIKSDTPVPIGIGGAEGKVYPTAIYARIQELGGQGHRGNIPARPYMAPALEASRPQLQVIAVAEWRRILPI